VFQYTLRG